ncbi:MAG: hypothetical protein HY816_20085 [Candidatus Wallbacteria bacterium]|nr:hypothetical protein [Candidatus Wallbacteria bacterium]
MARQTVDEILEDLSGALQADRGRGSDRGPAAAPPKVTSIALPRGEFLPYVMGSGPIAGGYLKGQVSRAGAGYGYSSLSLRSLRTIARTSPLLAAIHSVRVNQMLRMTRRIMDPKRDIGWDILHKDHFNPRVTVDPKEEDRVAAGIRPLFECPHPVHEPSFSGATSKIINDHMSMNRPVIQLLRNFRGELLQWCVRDGEEILPTFALARKYIDPGDKRPDDDRLASAWVKLRGELGYDVSEYEYVMMRDGRLVDTFAAGELLIPTFAPTSDTRDFGYPPSHVERAIEATLAFASSFRYNADVFTRGSMVDVILNLSGGYTDDARLALEDQLRARFLGSEGAHRIPIIQTEDKTDLQAVRLKEGNREMEFSPWMQALVSLDCAVYRMDPSEINFKGQAGEGGAIFEHNRESEVANSKDQGLNTMAWWFADAMTQLVRQRHPDYVFYIWGLNREDEAQALEIRAKELGTTKTIDELRAADGEKPFGKWWSQIPANTALVPYIAQEMQAQQQQARQQPGQGGERPPQLGAREMAARPGRPADEVDEIPDFEGRPRGRGRGAPPREAQDQGEGEGSDRGRRPVQKALADDIVIVFEDRP